MMPLGLQRNNMSYFNQPTVSRLDFRRALRRKVYEELNVDFNDLPDIIVIDDVWWEGQTEKEALQMIAGCIQDFKDELGFNSGSSTEAPLYSIDE